MSAQITTAMKKQYHANVGFLVQQKGSRLRKAVRVEEGATGEENYYDQIGEAPAAKKRETRHGDTPLMETPHARRRVIMSPYDWADMVDKPDKIRTLIDPESKYAINAAWSLGRGIDDELISAALGTAYTGKEGGTAVALPSAQKIAVASAGLTLAKLISAKEILDASEVDPDDPRFIWCTAKQISDLLGEEKLTSADYATVKALVMGQINEFMSFTFIRTQRLTTDGNGDRQVVAHAKPGILLAVGADIQTEIGPRADKNYDIQVWAHMDVGATRMQEEMVVEIACKE